MKRTLSLKREALTELTTSDLAAVAGGALASGATCPAVSCVCASKFCISNIGECVTWSCDVAG
jgi:hypothetical protein